MSLFKVVCYTTVRLYVSEPHLFPADFKSKKKSISQMDEIYVLVIGEDLLECLI